MKIINYISTMAIPAVIIIIIVYGIIDKSEYMTFSLMAQKKVWK